MTQSPASEEASPGNPLDLVEQIVLAHDWAFDRQSDDEMAVEVPGNWTDYTFYFAWRPDSAAVQLTCVFDVRMPEGIETRLNELLMRANERLWLGHFGLWTAVNLPVYRYAVLVRPPHGTGIEELEDLMAIAVAECERFYPAFQFVIQGGKSASEGLEAALLDTAGEA